MNKTKTNKQQSSSVSCHFVRQALQFIFVNARVTGVLQKKNGDERDSLYLMRTTVESERAR